MTTNSLRAKELREKERSNKRNERINEERNIRSDKTERRGQNLRAAESALSYLGGRQSDRARNATKLVESAGKAALAASLNDWEWYATNESLAKDTASLAWGYRNGAYIKLGRDIEDHTPGILTIDLLPSIGVSRDAASGVNTAARQIYSWVRHANSGSANYESADLMQVLVCLGNMYAIYGHCTRILGLLNAASHENAYLPRGILESMSVRYDESIKSIASDRARLNALGLQITRAFAAPKEMAYYKRMLFLFSHVYVDTPDTQFGQYYLYKPMGYYVYSEEQDMAKCIGIAYDEGKTLGANYNHVDPKTLSDWIDVLASMYEGMSRNETANIMSGDLRKAYSSENLWELPMIEADYTVQPHYDQVVLNQIWNTTVGITYPTVDLNIIQDAQRNLLIFTPRVKLEASSSDRVLAYLEADTTERRITTDIPDPDWKTTLEVTRTMYFTQKSDDAGEDEVVYDVVTCGSEIVGRGVVWTYVGASGTLNYLALGNKVMDPTTDAEALASAAFYKFYYHPCIDVLTPSSTNRVNAYFRRMMNMDRTAIMSPTTLKAMNDNIMVNMFYVPNRQ